MAAEPALVDFNCGRFFRAVTFPEDQPLLCVVEIAITQFLESNCAAIELPLLSGIVSTRDSPEKNARLSASRLWGPDAVESDSVMTCPASGPTLYELASFA